MAGGDANVEIALARSLVERLDEGDARRAWSKVFDPHQIKENLPPASDNGGVFVEPEEEVLPLWLPGWRQIPATNGNGHRSKQQRVPEENLLF
jgi:hypothetical protein